MNKVRQLGGLMARLEAKYDMNLHKLRMLSIASMYWEADMPVRVTDILGAYEDASRATTHRMIKELVSVGLFREKVPAEDLRVKFLQPGLKFDTLLKDIGKLS